MRKDKEQANNLRKLGKSYKEIHKEMGVPLSTLSDWFHNQGWSKEISIQLTEKAKSGHLIRLQELNKIRGENLDALYLQAEKEAIEEFEALKYHPLFIAGLMIYWGEGNKSSKGRCGIANTEPLMIALFVKFLNNVCGFKMEKIKAWILLYPDLDEMACKKFWIKNTPLQTENFDKSIYIMGKHKTKKVAYGVCSVGISSAYLKRKIMKWIEMLARDLSREDYKAGIF